MMMALGMFVFSLPTLAYQELQRKTEWKYATNSRVGLRDSEQYIGRGPETITLSGWFAPDLMGSEYSLDALRLMADMGKSWFLIQGTGRVYGSYIITSLDEGKTIIQRNGDSKRIEFTISLKRTDESLMNTLGLGDASDIKNMLDLDGITNSIQDKARDLVGSSVSTIKSVFGGGS